MFLKHGAKKVNEIELVAPTGFEPVFESRHLLGVVGSAAGDGHADGIETVVVGIVQDEGRRLRLAEG